MNLLVTYTLGHIQPQMLLKIRVPLNRAKDIVLKMLADDRKQVNKQALCLLDTHIQDKLLNRSRSTAHNHFPISRV